MWAISSNCKHHFMRQLFILCSLTTSCVPVESFYLFFGFFFKRWGQGENTVVAHLGSSILQQLPRMLLLLLFKARTHRHHYHILFHCIEMYRILFAWWDCWECNLYVDIDDSVQVDSVSLPAAMKGNLRFHNSLWKNCCVFKWRASGKKRSWHPATLHKTAGLLCVVMETVHSSATCSSALINSSSEMMEPGSQMKDGKKGGEEE